MYWTYTTDEKRDIDRKDSLILCRLFFECYLVIVKKRRMLLTYHKIELLKTINIRD